MLQVSGAFRTQVDDDIEDGAPCAPNELGFGCGGILEVHATNRAFLAIVRQVGLRNHRLEPVCPEFLLTKGPGKEAARILFSVQVDDEGTPKPGLGKNHVRTPLVSVLPPALNREIQINLPRATQ